MTSISFRGAPSRILALVDQLPEGVEVERTSPTVLTLRVPEDLLDEVRTKVSELRLRPVLDRLSM